MSDKGESALGTKSLNVDGIERLLEDPALRARLVEVIQEQLAEAPSLWRRLGPLLASVSSALVMVLAFFAINVYLARPVLESFLFSLALAVGLTPQLLPAMISINLAHVAQRMALAKVIVKRLASIENFGSTNVLCSDKTGTLTNARHPQPGF